MTKFNKTLNIVLAFICLISGIVAQDDAYEEANKQLNFLNSENFKSSISNGIWMVFFGASWCPHCRHLTPDWLKFQQEADEKELVTKYDFHIAKVECTESEDICREQGLRGYPTIILFNNGEKKGETNDRSPELLMNFAQKNIDTYYPDNLKYGYKRLSDEKLTAELSKVVPLEIGEETGNVNPEGKIVHLTDEIFQSAIDQGTWFIMFHAPWCGHCQRFAPTWEEFAGMMKNKMNIGKVDCTAYADICNKYGVTGYPTLKIIDKHEVIDFKGNRRIEDLEKFVEPYISSSTTVSKTGNINPEGKIVHLTDETFQSAIDKSTWFIMFHAPWCGHCQRFAPTWEEFAGMMKNKINIGKVDCTAYADICSKYGVTGYPTLKIIDKHEVNDFKGIRRIEDLEKFVEPYIGSSISVSKAETIRENMKNNEVLFFLYYNYAEPNVKEIKLFIDIINELNVLSAKVYLTPDEELMNSFNIEQGTTGIVVSRDYGKGFYKFEGQFNKEELKPWIEKYMYPFVIEITPLNSETYLNSKSYVVMGIFPTSDIKSPIYDNIRIASRAWAAQHEVDPTLRYSDKYIHSDFVWLDGSKFPKYIKSAFGLNIAELPRVIILNPSNGEYYDKGVSGKYLHDENISVSLSAAMNQQLKAKYIKGDYFSTLKENTSIQVILIIIVILFAVLIYLVFFNNKKKKVEYYLPVKMDNKQA